MKRRIYDDDADTYSLMALSDGSYDIDVAASFDSNAWLL
jgi:hypothetical protein